MRGAVLVALSLAGRVEVADGEIVVRDPRPVGDPDLDKALAGVGAAQWMGDFPSGYVSAPAHHHH